MHRFKIILQSEPEGGFTVLVPSLPGCVTYGRTLKEAKTMAKDAVLAYLASLKKRGESIPPDRKTLITSLDLKYVEAA